MKYSFRFLLLLIGVFLINISTAQVDNPVKWKLSSKQISDCEVEIQFTGTIEDHWHVYSLNKSGDDGPMPSNIFVDNSNDYETIGKPTEGTPIKTFDKVFEMNVAYFEKTVTFKQRIKLKANKEIVIKGKYEYQACTEEKCIFPPATPFEFKVKGTKACENAPSPEHVKWKFSSKKISDCEVEIQFTGAIEDRWHVYSLKKVEGDGPMPANIYLDKSNDYEAIGKPTESNPITTFDKVFKLEVAYFEKTVTFKQKIKLKANKEIVVKGKYEYQACTDEACQQPPITPFEFKFNGSEACETSVIDSGGASTIIKETPIDSSPKSSITPTITFKPDEVSPLGNPWWSILLTGFLWGFAALFTPCVFPLIPMNVSFFLKRSKTKAKGKLNALLYALSIIVIFVSLGLGISAIWGGGAIHSFATSPGFNFVIFILLLIFAASFLGAFEIVLPSSFVNKIDAQGDRGGFTGIFFMALALVVVSFSCTGPMVGNALVAASTSGNKVGAFWAMLGFSSGLALPFGLFAFFPSMLNSMPKSGGWLNTVKVVLGFLELALALKFASNVDVAYKWGILPREVFISLWIVIFGLMTIYLLGGFKTSHDSDVKHLSVTRLFFIILSFSVTIYIIPGLWGAPLKIFSGVLPSYENSESPYGFMGGGTVTSPTSNFDPEFAPYIRYSKNGIIHFKNDYKHALDYAKKVNKPLMIDFTGDQCANCRKTEDNIWPDAEVTKRLNNDVVLVSLFVDDKEELDPKDYQKVFWFGQEREITTVGDKFKYMEETLYKQSTQPLYVLIDHNEQLLSNPRGYKSGIADYVKWMDEGIGRFEKSKK